MARSIIVDTNEGAILVEGIPDDAKITYGPMTPGSKSYQGNERTLRIYTSNTNQLAVFVGVSAFRDLSLTVKKRKVTSESSSKQIEGPDGRLHDVTSATAWEWVEDTGDEPVDVPTPPALRRDPRY